MTGEAARRRRRDDEQTPRKHERAPAPCAASTAGRRRLVRRLVAEGNAILERPFRPLALTGEPAADALVNDLETTPHAFLLGCLMARQVREEVAFAIPRRLADRLGGLEFDRLARLSLDEWTDAVCRPAPLHRFKLTMPRLLCAAVARLADEWDGDAARLWAGRPSSRALVGRLLAFDGVGPKIATMAANMLARDFKIPLADLRAIDVSADRHVRRVFGRLGFAPPDPAPRAVVAAARRLHPEYPGVFDRPCFDLGRQVCRATVGRCADCPLNSP